MKGDSNLKAIAVPGGVVFHIVVGNVALCGVSGKFCSPGRLTGRKCYACDVRLSELRLIALRKRVALARKGLSSDYFTVLKDPRWKLCGGKYFHHGGELNEADPRLHFVVRGVALCNSNFTQKSNEAFPALNKCLTCLGLLGFGENIFPLRKRDFKRRFPREWKEYLRINRSVE